MITGYCGNGSVADTPAAHVGGVTCPQAVGASLRLQTTAPPASHSTETGGAAGLVEALRRGADRVLVGDVHQVIAPDRDRAPGHFLRGTHSRFRARQPSLRAARRWSRRDSARHASSSTAHEKGTRLSRLSPARTSGATWRNRYLSAVSVAVDQRRSLAGSASRYAGTLSGSSGPGIGSTGAGGRVSGVSGDSSPGSSGIGSDGSIGG